MGQLSTKTPHTVLSDRYELLVQRSESANVQHWTGSDQTLGRAVSVILVSGETLDATLDAARRVSVLNDARLTQVLDIGRQDIDGTEYGFVIHDEMSGKSLADMAQRGPLTAEVARSVIGEIAHTLEIAANAGLHHGVITGQHVVQNEAGDLRLIGTAVEAAAAGSDDEDGAVAARRDAVDLVKLLYLCLTGKSASNVEEHPPQSVVSSVPADLDTLCVTTLGPHDDGPISPAELASSLRPWSRVPDDIDNTSILSSNVDVVTEQADADHDAPVTPVTGDDGESAEEPTSAEVSTDQDPAQTAKNESRDSLPVATAALSVDGSDVADISADPTKNPHTTSAILSGGVGLDSFAQRLPSLRNPSSFPGGSITTKDADQPSGWQSAPTAAKPGQELPPFEQVIGTHQFAVPPLTRRSSNTGASVIAVFSAIIVVVLLISMISVFGNKKTEPTLNDRLANPTSTPSFSGSTKSAEVTPTPTETSTAAEQSGPVTIQKAKAHDPEGDNTENDSSVANAIDGNKSTSWNSSTYKSSTFGGLKSGVGLVLTPNPEASVSSITISDAGKGGVVEVHKFSGNKPSKSSLLGTLKTGGTSDSLTFKEPLKGANILLWYTTLPKSPSGKWRAEVADVSME